MQLWVYKDIYLLIYNINDILFFQNESEGENC